MVTRRRLLTLSSAAALGAVAGCSSPTTSAPDPSPSASGAATGSATPSASASASAPATPSTTPTPVEPPAPRVAGTIAGDLDVPWGLAFLTSGDALVSERNTGRIVRVGRDGEVNTLGEIPGVEPPTGIGEGGLLGIALAPGDEGTLFAYLTTASDNRVIRIGVGGNALGSPRDVLTGIPTSVHHNGGAILFDADGNLLVATGDAENPDTAQDRNSLSGKILRIKPDGSAAVGNPYDNRTWTYGHRNVEGLAFDGQGRLWATEFGDKVADELNLITKGRNYGWPEVEGDSSDADFEAPRAVWEPTSSCSPAGLAIARSTAFVGALQGQCLFAVALDGTSAGEPKAYFAGDHGRIRGVHVAPDGSLWMTTSNTDGRRDPGADDDKILRVTL